MSSGSSMPRSSAILMNNSQLLDVVAVVHAVVAQDVAEPQSFPTTSVMQLQLLV